MQSSTCLQQIRPFGKRDEAMYKTAADSSLRHHMKINLANRAVSIVCYECKRSGCVSNALLKMRAGPSKSACRSWLQITSSCAGKESAW